jgi:mycothiol synthase
VWRIETWRALDDAPFDAVVDLIGDATEHDGFPALSDQLWLDLTDRLGSGFAAVLAFDASNRLAGYAQLAGTNKSTSVEVVISPIDRRKAHELTVVLLRAAFDEIATTGGGTVHWWAHHPDAIAEAVAAEVGLTLGRRLFQLRRSLPIDATTTVETRDFEVGRDELEWLRVNNAAFRDHPEQGGWTLDTLRQREAEPWFDSAGFRLHERDGRLAAFCWTKVHSDATPPMGEIYVIAVDPAFHGTGLGRALTIAGLAHLASIGLTVGMLHVDAANTAALSLYEGLGFTVHHADHAYMVEIPARAEETRR